MQTDLNKAIVWSQTRCNYCDMAKRVLHANGYTVQERIIGMDEGNWMKEDFQKAVPGARSVPQIFIGTTYVGGYQDLVKYLNDNSKNA
jgi:glutaredoxin 3